MKSLFLFFLSTKIWEKVSPKKEGCTFGSCEGLLRSIPFALPTFLFCGFVVWL